MSAKWWIQFSIQAVLFLVGLGGIFVPQIDTWLYTSIIWGVAVIWAIITFALWRKSRGKYTVRDEESSKKSPIEDIKDDLITLNSREKEAATKRVKENYPEEIAIRIYDNFVATFGGNIASIITNVIKGIVQKRNTDPLIEFFKKLGDILDSVSFGLKSLLVDDNLYKATLEDLAKKRLKVKGDKNKKATIQSNIARVRDLSYGLNSSVILRGVLSHLPPERLKLLSVIIVNLEGIEKSMETTLNAMLDDLENEWKVKDEEIRGFEAILPTLSILEGLIKYE